MGGVAFTSSLNAPVYKTRANGLSPLHLIGWEARSVSNTRQQEQDEDATKEIRTLEKKKEQRMGRQL